jgi:hypothetical protein
VQERLIRLKNQLAVKGWWRESLTFVYLAGLTKVLLASLIFRFELKCATGATTLNENIDEVNPDP